MALKRKFKLDASEILWCVQNCLASSNVDSHVAGAVIVTRVWRKLPVWVQESIRLEIASFLAVKDPKNCVAQIWVEALTQVRCGLTVDPGTGAVSVGPHTEWMVRTPDTGGQSSGEAKECCCHQTEGVWL